MSTNATVSVKTPSGEYANMYVHYDGYPSNMIPALYNHSDDELLDAKEIRFISTTELSAFDDAKNPDITNEPEKLYGSYHYVKDADGNWREVNN